jgi:hypothetical protein
LPELKRFLLERGEIYTVRRYRMSEAYVEIEGVGRCRRIPLGKVSDVSQLKQFVSASGFDTAEDWWSKILSFIPEYMSQERVAKYLYRVVRV